MGRCLWGCALFAWESRKPRAAPHGRLGAGSRMRGVDPDGIDACEGGFGLWHREWVGPAGGAPGR